MTSSRRLDTVRLLLPPLAVGHTEALSAIYADPEVARYVGGDRLTAETIPWQVEAFAEEWDQRGYGQSAVLDRETGEFLGRIGLHFWPEWNEVELGYVFGQSAQGKGLAFEGSMRWIEWAKSEPGIDYLIANIHPDNAASIGLAKKLGFTFSRYDTTPSGLLTLIYRLDL
jgi:RimJ/RimL family protein N-acetyltransferase